MFSLIKSLTCLKICHVDAKTRSLGQIFEKPCVHSRGYIFSPIIMKLGQNVFIEKISDDFENCYVGPKTRSLGQMLELPCLRSRGHNFSPIIMKFDPNFCLDELPDKLENRSCRVKN